MPCRPAEDDLSLNPGHGYEAARLLLWASEQLDRDPPIWAYDLARYPGSQDKRPTRALCRLLSLQPATVRERLFGNEDIEASRLQDWWDRHCRADAARKNHSAGG